MKREIGAVLYLQGAEQHSRVPRSFTLSALLNRKKKIKMPPPFLPRTVLLQGKTPDQAFRLLARVMTDDKTMFRLKQTRFEPPSVRRERVANERSVRIFRRETDRRDEVLARYK